MRLPALLAAIMAVSAMPATAAVVASSLPYPNTPDWTDIVFGGTSMTTNGTTSTTLTTANTRGVWFGWQQGSNTPAWAPASNANGNYLDLTMSLGAGAREWSAYFYDGTRGGAFQFNPVTNCNGNATDCTLADYQSGVTMSFVTAGNVAADIFVPMDLTVSNRFEMLVKGTRVDYRINGRLYSGLAGASGSRILLVGDGSGSTRTGFGSMTITGVSFETAPAFSELEDLSPPPVSAVPEPASWVMLLAGFGLAGATMRRRRFSAAM